MTLKISFWRSHVDYQLAAAKPDFGSAFLRLILAKT